MNDETPGTPDPEPFESARQPSMPGPGVARVVSAGLVSVTDPVVAILLLAGFFDGISDNWIHATLLWAVAVALGVDAVRRRWGLGGAGPYGRPLFVPSPDASEGARAARRFQIGLLVGVLALVYAVIGGGFVRYTWPITVMIVLPAAAVVAIAWRGPLRPRETPGPLDTAGAAWWGAAFVSAALIELVSLLMQPTLRTDSWAHPTISVLMESLLSSHAGRSVGLLMWLGLGWLLLDR